MSKMKQLDLRRQEVVDQCDEMRWENEGVGLSDVQVKIVEYAFMQGMAHLMDEALLEVRDYLEAKENEAVDAEVGEYVDTHQTKEQDDE